MRFISPILILFLCLVVSCKKDPAALPEHDHGTDETVVTGKVTLNFTNVSDNDVIQVSKDTAYTASTPKYITANNDTFSVITLKYYISNIRLKRSNGTWYTQPESYYLIDANDSLNYGKIVMNNVPIDDYIEMEFMLGVDSMRNCSGAQSGALDVSHDMFWSWNQGYIFFKLEGYSSSQSVSNTKNVIYHVGGFKTPYKNMRTISMSLPIVMQVHSDHSPTIFMKTNIQECFRNPNLIDIATYGNISSAQTIKIFVINYVDMFSISAIKH
jgi:hypothetical protein